LNSTEKKENQSFTQNHGISVKRNRKSGTSPNMNTSRKGKLVPPEVRINLGQDDLAKISMESKHIVSSWCFG